LNSLEESLFNELFLQDKKSEQLKEKLSNLNKSLQRHQEKFKKNLNDLKRVVDKKSKLIHKKNVSEKFGDSTFFTSRTAGFTQISAAGDQGLSNSLSNIKGLAYLKPEITDLKGKMLLRDELKDALELYSKNYEKKIIKIQELKNKLEKSPADEIFDGKFTESELKLLKNRIFILEKEVENEKSELGFLKNISMIGQRFQDFQDRDIDMLERVY
jgi:predicted nuclease with TOPRIM domain